MVRRSQQDILDLGFILFGTGQQVVPVNPKGNNASCWI